MPFDPKMPQESALGNELWNARDFSGGYRLSISGGIPIEHADFSGFESIQEKGRVSRYQ
jgi:hypothetical protein